MLPPNTTCHFEASMCFKFKVMITHIALALLLDTETRAYWSSLPHKASGNKMRFFLHPPSPFSTHPTSSPRKREGKSCLSEQKEEADLTATRTICQTIWLLSSPDRREEWCVRKSREFRIQRACISSGFLPSPQWVVLPGLSFLKRDFPEPSGQVSMRSKSPWVALKNED